VRWANGVEALAFTPEAPGRSRSENLDYAWLTEIVDWLHTTRREAFDTITTAVRTGVAQYVWDTTSKGKNNVIRFLLDQHDACPDDHRIVRGTMFDNPFLGRNYLRDETRKYVRGSRRWREEVMGEVFDENAGALWQQHWLDDNRITLVPNGIMQTILGCDPALSDRPDADETGLVECALDTHGHVYVTRDMTAHHTPEAWGDLIVERCIAGAAGVVIERNHLGDNARANISARAKERGQRVVVIPHGARAPFPRRVPGTIVVREVVSRTSKGTRAHPVASLYQLGRVHHVGALSELELELTTWEPDVRGESPNRLDALCEAVNELAETLVDIPAPRAGAICDAADVQHELVTRVHARAHGPGRGRLGL
jgi:phage terminase large subunit-like protein